MIYRILLSLPLAAFTLMACGEADDRDSAQSGGGGASSGGAGGSGEGAATDGGGTSCGLGPDADRDGHSAEAGDCDDCDPMVHPEAAELIAPPGFPALDENCDGRTDERPTCDSGLALDDTDPMSAAHAIDLCETGAAMAHGLVAARWAMPDGSLLPVDEGPLAQYHLGHGLMDRFGANAVPREGNTLLALSTGTARNPTDLSYRSTLDYEKGFFCALPPGFTFTGTACEPIPFAYVDALDPVALELDIRLPPGAKGVAFDVNYYSQEVREESCTFAAPDTFAALVTSGFPARPYNNIALDNELNALNPASPFNRACDGCELGTSLLIGTGFGPDTYGSYAKGAATGWLTIAAPFEGGSSITLRLALWEDGDTDFFWSDSETTVLVDNFRWLSHAVDAVMEPAWPR